MLQESRGFEVAFVVGDWQEVLEYDVGMTCSNAKEVKGDIISNQEMETHQHPGEVGTFRVIIILVLCTRNPK
jgi:hypothetical protein